MMHDDAEIVERMAKAAAFATRQQNDSSADEEEFWLHTADVVKCIWRGAISAAIAAMPPQDLSQYQRGFEDGCAHMKEDYEAGKRLDARALSEGKA